MPCEQKLGLLGAKHPFVHQRGLAAHAHGARQRALLCYGHNTSFRSVLVPYLEKLMPLPNGSSLVSPSPISHYMASKFGAWSIGGHIVIRTSLNEASGASRQTIRSSYQYVASSLHSGGTQPH